jgi:hypothetical protein
MQWSLNLPVGLFFAHSAEQAKELSKKCGIKGFREKEHVNAMTGCYEGAALIFCDKGKMSVETAAHESLHVVTHWVKYLGMTNPDEEFISYLIGQVASQIHKEFN